MNYGKKKMMYGGKVKKKMAQGGTTARQDQLNERGIFGDAEAYDALNPTQQKMKKAVEKLESSLMIQDGKPSNPKHSAADVKRIKKEIKDKKAGLDAGFKSYAKDRLKFRKSTTGGKKAEKFIGKYPADYLVEPSMTQPVWHLVGGLDPIKESELIGDEPDDGYPVLLRDWIQRDGLKCLKIKLRGNDLEWDFQRLVEIGDISLEENVTHLTTDFNCMVTDPSYVNEILDRIAAGHREIYDRIVYVEQPFPYDLEANQIDVHSVSERKPLFMDESAHDWRFVKLGRELGWTSVALKTCKTLTGAILSLCWAKEHDMTLMVQDLTNPRLAQVPHVLLAAYAGTICGVESNAMQFYPEASSEFLKVHPGLYQRRNGVLDLSTLSGPGFGYAGVESLA